jgi:hypothetical protein
MLERLRQRLELLRAVVAEPEVRQRISSVAAFAVIAEYKNRIFVEGLTSDGSQIGQYSTRPFYQNPNALIGVAASGVSPEGKSGKSRFKNGNTHKTKYLPRGYAELRELTGRESGKVDLNFSGSLERSIKVVDDGEGAAITYTNDFEADKMAANEIRFGADISGVSEDEIEIGVNAAVDELRFILEEIENDI